MSFQILRDDDLGAAEFFEHKPGTLYGRLLSVLKNEDCKSDAKNSIGRVGEESTSIKGKKNRNLKQNILFKRSKKMTDGWGEKITISTDKGSKIEVSVGEPFAAAVNRVAEEANYGKHFRVFLAGKEIEPDECPETILLGQDIKLTSYDKVGVN